MIPNVTVSWCTRQAQCRWCEQPVEAGTPMVSVFFWNRGVDGKRGWNVKHHYHLLRSDGKHCWDEQGLDYLKLNPYVPYIRGRRMKLSKKDSRSRLLILKRKAELDQRRRNLKPDAPEYTLRLAVIEAKVAGLAAEILDYGGMPKSWMEELLR